MPQGGLTFDADLDAAELRVAIVVARFNSAVTSALYDGCRDELTGHNAHKDNVFVTSVPGCFELPLAARNLAMSDRFDAIICLGAIIRGDTPHFEYVSMATANGIQRAALDTGTPVIFGVVTTDNEQQAMARAGGPAGHKGREAALTAIEMAHTMRRLSREGARGRA